MEVTRVGRPIAEEAQHDLIQPLQLPAEAGSHGQRYAAGYDSVGAQAPQIQVGHVHGAAAPATDARILAQQLGHHGVHILALGDSMAMTAMGGGDVVIGPESGNRSDRHRLFADVEVHRPVDLAGEVELMRRLLKCPNQIHLTQQFDEAVGGEVYN
ncbi:MAG: hypothetical protein MAG451_02653 [Anaerolineales bacterium]|nr:hypothetical protein [Anaerolineales bacterium]